MPSVTDTETQNLDGETNDDLMRKRQEDLAASALDQKFLNKIAKAHDDLEQIKTQRDNLNTKKAEVITNLVDMGLDRKAVKAALAYVATPEDQRQLFDLSYAATRKALGVPIQDDLFVAQVERTVQAHQARRDN